MARFNVMVEETVVSMYEVEAASQDEAEQIGIEAHESTAQPGYMGFDVADRQVRARAP